MNDLTPAHLKHNNIENNVICLVQALPGEQYKSGRFRVVQEKTPCLSMVKSEDPICLLEIVSIFFDISKTMNS